MITQYSNALKQYAGFKGRSSRTDYWMFTLANIFLGFVAMYIDIGAGLTYKPLPYGVIYSIYSLAVLIPGLAITARRLHDSGKSGWFMLIGLIPGIGGVILIVFLLMPSQKHDNLYGVFQNTESESLIKPINPEWILLFIACWFLFTNMLYKGMELISSSYYSWAVWDVFIYPLISLVWSLIPISIGFAVKDKTKQIVIFIAGALYMFIYLYREISYRVAPQEFIDFQF